jgi:uncharacterized protein (DUF1684 family)
MPTHESGTRPTPAVIRRTVCAVDALELAHWRRTVAHLYANVGAEDDPAASHALWRIGRDELFRHHPQSPLLPDDPMRATGLPYWPYDPALRFETAVAPPREPATLTIDTASDGRTNMRLVGQVTVAELGITLDVWWLAQYAGGLFLPVRDGTAGHGSYGGGRYLLDTAKGADLGGDYDRLVLDFNFLYHPSCRYNPAWECPLAPAGNTTPVPLQAGERM